MQAAAGRENHSASYEHHLQPPHQADDGFACLQPSLRHQFEVDLTTGTVLPQHSQLHGGRVDAMYNSRFSSANRGNDHTRELTEATEQQYLHSTAASGGSNANLLCAVCCKVFSGRNRKYNMDIHMRIHTGETPFECTLCPYKAKRKHHLQRHVLYKHQ